MTRPPKRTVDYFPHDCKHGKTLSILQKRYGNDGYAAWFKILEILGVSDGHYIDCNDSFTWEFLTSEILVEPDKCREIIGLLARLDAIDSELWESNIIWSDNFIARISDAYRNRTSEIPIRPDNLRQKPSLSRQSYVRNPQTKLKESKVKETKGKDLCSLPSYPSDFESLWQAYPRNNRGSKKEAYREYNKHYDNMPDNVERIVITQVAEKSQADSRGIFYPEFPHLVRWIKRALWEKEPFDFSLSQGPQRQLSKADQITAGNLAARERAIAKVGGE